MVKPCGCSSRECSCLLEAGLGIELEETSEGVEVRSDGTYFVPAIVGLFQQGVNVAVEGSGAAGDPFLISAEQGGSIAAKHEMFLEDDVWEMPEDCKLVRVTLVGGGAGGQSAVPTHQDIVGRAGSGGAASVAYLHPDDIGDYLSIQVGEGGRGIVTSRPRAEVGTPAQVAGGDSTVTNSSGRMLLLAGGGREMSNVGAGASLPALETVSGTHVPSTQTSLSAPVGGGSGGGAGGPDLPGVDREPISATDGWGSRGWWGTALPGEGMYAPPAAGPRGLGGGGGDAGVAWDWNAAPVPGVGSVLPGFDQPAWTRSFTATSAPGTTGMSGEILDNDFNWGGWWDGGGQGFIASAIWPDFGPMFDASLVGSGFALEFDVTLSTTGMLRLTIGATLMTQAGEDIEIGVMNDGDGILRFMFASGSTIKLVPIPSLTQGVHRVKFRYAAVPGYPMTFEAEALIDGVSIGLERFTLTNPQVASLRMMLGVEGAVAGELSISSPVNWTRAGAQNQTTPAPGQDGGWPGGGGGGGGPYYGTGTAPSLPRGGHGAAGVVLVEWW